MKSDDKAFVLVVAFVATSFIALMLSAMAAGVHERNTNLKETEAAIKAGLVQKYDKDARKVIWTKP